MKVLILSDTHGYLDPRIASLARDADYAVHAGDVGGTDVLMGLRPRYSMLAIRGNNDVVAKWAAEGLAALSALPDEATLQLPGGTLVAVHGHRHGPPKRRHERLRRAYPNARCIIYGHSHRAICDLEKTPWVLNPGAAGRARTFGGPACLVLTATSKRWTIAPRRFDNH